MMRKCPRYNLTESLRKFIGLDETDNQSNQTESARVRSKFNLRLNNILKFQEPSGRNWHQ